MFRGDKYIAIGIALLFCAKTFFMSFFALDQHPRYYQLKVQRSAYGHPTTYLWVTFLSNLTAFMAGFFLFAGLCESLYAFFSPAFAVVVCFIVCDLFFHCLFLFVTVEFHMLMVFNLSTTVVFAGCMYFVYKYSKEFDELNPEQVLQRNGSASE